MQDELEAIHQHLTQQQRSNLAKMEKQGWEAADWKARALESTQKFAAANAQVSTDSCGVHAVVIASSWITPLLLPVFWAASRQGVLPKLMCCSLALVTLVW